MHVGDEVIVRMPVGIERSDADVHDPAGCDKGKDRRKTESHARGRDFNRAHTDVQRRSVSDVLQRKRLGADVFENDERPDLQLDLP